MKTNSQTGRWFTVATFANAMAWAEAAVVFYLRTMVDRIEPYQARPLPEFEGLSGAELVREASTLVMLATVGILAGRTWRGRFGYAALAFGIWDIFYYLFMMVICGWPNSLLDWDILFLLPLPWWGPVLAPVSIAVLMIVWGTLVARIEPGAPTGNAERGSWALAFAGALIALYVFMADAIRVLGQGEEAVRNVLPVQFNWPVFIVGWALMSAPVVVLLRPGRRGENAPSGRRGPPEPASAKGG